MYLKKPNIDRLLQSFQIKQLSELTFQSKHQSTPNGIAFGGETFAQAVLAATQTVPADRSIHSMHGYFIRPGSITTETIWKINKIKDGKGYSLRQITAIEDQKEIFTALASFENKTASNEMFHQNSLPAYIPDELLSVDPETLPTAAAELIEFNDSEFDYWKYNRNFDIRYVVDPPYYHTPTNNHLSNLLPKNNQLIWVKSFAALENDPKLHQAALAYLSDYFMLEPALRNQNRSWTKPSIPNLIAASIDHNIWWHQPTRVDEWLLVWVHTPAIQSQRAIGIGGIYNRAGKIVASIAQEGVFYSK